MARREEEFAALRRAREQQLAERRARRKQERDLERRRAYLQSCRQQVLERVRAVQAAEEARNAEQRKKVRHSHHWEGTDCCAHLHVSLRVHVCATSPNFPMRESVF